MASGSVGIEGRLITSQKQIRFLHVATKSLSSCTLNNLACHNTRLLYKIVCFIFFLYPKGMRSGQRLVLANALPKDALPTYGVGFY